MDDKQYDPEAAYTQARDKLPDLPEWHSLSHSLRTAFMEVYLYGAKHGISKMEKAMVGEKRKHNAQPVITHLCSFCGKTSVAERDDRGNIVCPTEGCSSHTSRPTCNHEYSSCRAISSGCGFELVCSKCGETKLQAAPLGQPKHDTPLREALSIISTMK